jgi:hypothetical protein
MARRGNSVPRPIRCRDGHASIQERKSNAWTAEEDQILIRQRCIGTKWKEVAERHISSKTSNACRKRHERLIKNEVEAAAADSVNQHKLAMAYREHREAFWKMIADECGVKMWEAAESMVG